MRATVCCLIPGAKQTKEAAYEEDADKEEADEEGVLQYMSYRSELCLSCQSLRKSKRLAGMIKVSNIKMFSLRETSSCFIGRLLVNYTRVSVVRLLSMGLVVNGCFYTPFHNLIADLSRAHSMGIDFKRFTPRTGHLQKPPDTQFLQHQNI